MIQTSSFSLFLNFKYNYYMYFKSKKISLLILAVTAMVSSRAMFLFIDDPEGPNLLIVTVLAAIIYFLSLGVYRFNPSTQSVLKNISHTALIGLKRLLFAVFIQIVIVTILYFCLELESGIRAVL